MLINTNYYIISNLCIRNGFRFCTKSYIGRQNRKGKIGVNVVALVNKF